jgi:hypothetical protein
LFGGLFCGAAGAGTSFLPVLSDCIVGCCAGGTLAGGLGSIVAPCPVSGVWVSSVVLTSVGVCVSVSVFYVLWTYVSSLFFNVLVTSFTTGNLLISNKTRLPMETAKIVPK